MDTGLDRQLPVEDRELELRELRSEIERLRAAGSAAADAADAQSSFLAHVSHELRTPMNGVLGMARLTLATELSDEQREYVTVIEESANSLLTLVNDLLDKAKIDAGRLELEAIPFRLDDLVGRAIRGVRIMADHKGLRLSYERDPAIPAMVLGDPTRLRQVLLNLVSNAAKFTEKGSIEVSVAASGSDRVAFAVRDTGIGIARDKLTTIFEEFSQADTSTTRQFGGTGLGLSISARLVDMMGGSLEVDSEPGAGSTFRFTIHLPGAADDGGMAARAIGDRKGGSVVWLTDEPASRSGAIELVSQRGMEPQISSTIDAALEALRTNSTPAAVIVVDLRAGALDVAWELAREAQGAPIIVITPGGQRGDAARCRSMGVSGYLTGPVVPADVADAIDAVFAGVTDLVTRHWLNERRKSLRILIADDSATNRTLLVRMVEGRGHTAIQAADGESVVEIVGREDLDVILLDLHMPRLDGFDAAAQIRALPGTQADVPIIAVSGSVSDAGRERCRALGIDDFIAKPFRPEHILEVIEQVV